MPKKLVIAEKPDVARTLASYLGAPKQSQMVFENEKWVVSSCRGHVVDLMEPDEYEGKPWGKPWDASVLPMLPDEFGMRPVEGAEDVLKTLSKLISRKDVTEIVHACDPDREGEAILRRVISYTGTMKPVKRLWATSLEASALKSAFAKLEDDSAYDGLGDAALGRACADWLVGMNVTRALTCLYKRMVHAGRVISPTLHLICERTRQAASFESVPFWQIVCTVGGITFTSERFDDKNAAEAALAAAKGKPFHVDAVSESSKTVKSPSLYDLTNIQKDASRVYSMTASETLDALQALYEKKLTTYPRTDTDSITADDRASFEQLIGSEKTEGMVGAEAAALAASMPQDVSKVIAKGEVMGHTALLTTPLLDKKQLDKLPENEQNAATLILARMLTSVAPDAKTRTVKVEGCVGDLALSASGTEETVPGWRAVERAILPKTRREDEGAVPEGFEEGREYPVDDIVLEEKKTKPPKLYTESTLLSAMEHADKLVTDTALKGVLNQAQSHPAGLGTPATRADIIERLVSYGYIARKKKNLYATDEGLAIDELLPPRLVSADLTAEWEQRLSDIEAGDARLGPFTDQMKEFTAQLVADCTASFKPDKVASRQKSGIGACPRCGKPLIVNKAGTILGCSSRRSEKKDDAWVVIDEGCGFRFFTTVCGKKLTARQVESLADGKTVSLKGLARKDGGSFDAKIRLSKTEARGWEFVADRAAPRRKGGGRG